VLAKQRQREILNRLEFEAGVRTSDLAQEWGVAEETIRRDLERLERQKKLLRIHGGAIPIDEQARELPLPKREAINRELKVAIACRVAQEVAAGQTLFLDASSTIFQLAKALPDISLTILTNAQNVVRALHDRSFARVICLGGIYDRASQSFTGRLAEDSLSRYRIDRAYFSANGIDARRGVSEVNEEQARLKERVIHLAEESVFLADRTKLDVRSRFFFCPIGELDRLVTNAGADPASLGPLRRTGLAVELAEPMDGIAKEPGRGGRAASCALPEGPA